MTVTTLPLFDDPPDNRPTRVRPRRGGSETNADTLLTPAEAAAVLKIGRSKLYELIARGLIESVKLGRCRRFRRSDLDRFIRDLAAKPSD
jgi:excisionase family DNA binding protein